MNIFLRAVCVCMYVYALARTVINNMQVIKKRRNMMFDVIV